MLPARCALRPPMTAHVLRTMVVGLLVAALLVVQSPGRAHAELSWCWDDPLVEINGVRYSIENGVRGDPATIDKDVTVARTVIHVPKGSSARLIGLTRQHFPETVAFVRSLPADAGMARVETTYVATADLPAAIRVNGTVLAQGSTLGGTLSATFPLTR
jgi:hypothetical protein